MRFDIQGSVSNKLVLACGAVIGSLLIAAAGAITLYSGKSVGELSADYSGALGEAAAQQVSGELTSVQQLAVSMANAVGVLHEKGGADRATVMAMLRPNVDASNLVMGSWFFAAPDAFDGPDARFAGRVDLGSNSNGRFEPYWATSDGQVIMDPPEDNAVFGESFYTLAAQSGKPAITDPYTYQVGDKTVFMTSVAAPVFSNGRLIGVLGLDLELGDLAENLAQLRPFGDGRVMLLTGSGKWVAHPNRELWLKDYADAGVDTVKGAISGRTAASIDGFKDGGVAMQRLIVPVALPASNATWAVVVDAPTKTVQAPARNLAFGLLIGGLLIIALVLASLMYLSRRVVSQPLSRLIDAVNRLKNGQYDRPVSVGGGRDETAQVAQALEGFRADLAGGVAMRARQEQAAKEQAMVVDTLQSVLSSLSSGDLRARIQADFPSDYAQLKADYNAAAASLERAIGEVAGKTSAITATAGEISNAADDLSRRTEQQAASLEETAAALDQITATVSRMAQGAGHARSVVANASATAQDSGEVMQAAVNAMADIERSSRQINEIIGVIDEIAFQTNLLALNAGVEAARAGDSGRGFAVVASEVRALAQRSAEAAREIKVLISDSSRQVETGADLVSRTGRSLTQIVSQVGDITGIVNEIAASAQEQATGLAEINTAVNQMDQMTQQNAAMVEESTAASLSLAAEASELKTLIGQFQVEGEGDDDTASPVHRQHDQLERAFG